MGWGQELEVQGFWDGSGSLFRKTVGGELITEITLMPDYR